MRQTEYELLRDHPFLILASAHWLQDLKANLLLTSRLHWKHLAVVWLQAEFLFPHESYSAWGPQAVQTVPCLDRRGKVTQSPFLPLGPRDCRVGVRDFIALNWASQAVAVYFHQNILPIKCFMLYIVNVRASKSLPIPMKEARSVESLARRCACVPVPGQYSHIH